MNNDRVTEVYEGTASQGIQHRITRQRIHWMCQEARGQRILDIGCSQGIASILLAREGRDVVGVDHEDAALDFARERLREEEPAVRERLQFLQAEANALPFGAAEFDAVVMGEIIEHLVDPVPVLDEALRVLKPDGRLVLTVPYGVHAYHDHKEPIYIRELERLFDKRFAVVELVLIDRYVGAVATPLGARKGRTSLPLPQALEVAEGRLANQDRALVTAGQRAHTQAKEAEQLRDQAEQLQGELEAILSREQELTASLAAADQKLTESVEAAERHAQTQAAEAERLRRELAAGAELANRLAVDIERLEELHAQLTDELSSVEERLGAATSEGAELRRELKEVAELRASLTMAERLARDTRIAFEHCVVELDASYGRQYDLHRELAVSEHRAKAQAAEAKNQKAKAEQLGKQLEAARKEAQELRDERAAMEKRIAWRLRNPFGGLEGAGFGRRLRYATHLASWVILRPTPTRWRWARAYFALRRSGLFDYRFYVRRYKDVARSGVNPLMHYIEFGAREGRNPSPRFNTRAYLADHPGLDPARANPLLDFLRSGQTAAAGVGSLNGETPSQGKKGRNGSHPDQVGAPFDRDRVS